MENINGHLILLMAPSGSGKTMLIEGLGNLADKLYFAKTYTSRPRRTGIGENPKYVFVSKGEFEEMIEKGEFVEWANYSGNYYGTPKSDLLEELAKSQILFKEMELQGINQMKSLIDHKHLTVIYIDAGDWDSLRNRIIKRAPISEEELELRRLRYEEESKSKDISDIIISNHDGETEKAQAEFRKAISEIIDRVK